MGTFHPEKLNPTPTEGALLKAADTINASLRSRAHLLSIIDGLELDNTPLDIKMVYVLALLNLGFSKARALARLKVTPKRYYEWKQNEENQTRLEECEARGELILEETLLLAAESDPKIAMAVLTQKDKNKEKIEDKTPKEDKSIDDLFRDALRGKGTIVESEIVKEVPDELN